MCRPAGIWLCRESRNGLSLADSFRHPAECAQCGGTAYSAFANVTGTWTPYTWQPLRWVQRSYAAASTYGPAFDTALFSADFDAVIGALEYSALVSQLACDCTGSSLSTLDWSSTTYSVLVTRMAMLVGIWTTASLIITLRWIYFALIIGGLVSTGLYHATVRVRGDFRRPMLIAFAAANSLLYVFLLAVIGVYVHSSASSTAIASCGQTSLSDVAAVLAKAYKITLSWLWASRSSCTGCS